MAIKIQNLFSLRLIFIIFVLFLGSCDKEPKKVQNSDLELIKVIQLAVKEPSGLCFSANKNAFYTVSDNSGKVYKLSLTGAIIETLSYVGDDLEGVTVDPNNGNIYIVEERRRELVKLDSKGKEINRKHINIEENSANKGLEGVTYNSKNNHIYILNEADPGLLVELDVFGKILRQTKLNFANDYSGIFHEKIEDVLWIISDKSKTITKCDLNGDKINSYKIKESKAEGIVVDATTKRIYIVFDGLDKMQVYKY